MKTLPAETKMYRALLERDRSFEGIFFVGVKTTGIFCRPTCRARKPKRENVDFFASPKEALAHGYRPCKVCYPLKPSGDYPDWISGLMSKIEKSPSERIRDGELRSMGLDPNRVRRWFKKNHQITFQAYLRSLRLGQAFGHLTTGGKVIDAAFANGYESLSGFTEAFKKLVGTSPRASREKGVIHAYQLATPVGPMLVASVEEGICFLEFTDRRGLETQIKTLQKRFEAPIMTSKGPYFDQLKKELREYFDGKRKSFDVPIALKGTEFQNKVWKALLKIPYGQTRSYKEQAIAVGNPKAVRAVARANGENRIAILIPCHRVIGSSGELVGYAGGLERKKFLLETEGYV